MNIHETFFELHPSFNVSLTRHVYNMHATSAPYTRPGIWFWHIHDYIDSVKHFDILTKEQEKNLRKADAIEIKIGEFVEYEKPKN